MRGQLTDPEQVYMLCQRIGRAPQPSITLSCQAGGWWGGGQPVGVSASEGAGSASGGSYTTTRT